MRRFKHILVCFLLFFMSIGLFSEEDECRDCSTHPTKSCCDQMPWLKICQPPREPDSADDNFSYSTENDNKFYFITPDVLIYRRGQYEVYEKGNLGENEDAFTDLKESAGILLNSGKTIVFPSGSLFGKESDTTLKIVLEEYVQAGGTIIVFAQQYGWQVDKIIPIPEDESLKTYGWREDQSCLRNSIYFNSTHPVLSSCASQLVNAGVDGYFSSYPSNSTILLKRRTNTEPAMLIYPYGNGYVILTSIFTDWAYAHSQVSTSELDIVRDLLTFAKSPNESIVMYDLADNPTPTVNLNIKVSNSSEEQATKVAVKVYTPDRSRLLYETQQGISLAGGEEIDIPIEFTLPPVISSEMGICHIDYELYNTEEIPVQLFTESISGRFAIYKVIKTYTPPGNYSVWVTAKKDYFMWNEPADLELHVKNYSDEPITMDWYYDWTHEGHNVLPEITVPANGEIDYSVQLDFPQRTRRYLSTFLEMFWVWHRPGENSNYSAFGKGIHVRYPQTRNTNVVINPNWVKTGDPVNYTISTKNANSTPLENVEIKAFLEKRQWPDYQFETIATIYDSTQNLGANQTFSYSGSYTPPELLTTGMYYLRLEVTRPDGSISTASTNFSVSRSYINVYIKPIPDTSQYPNSGVERYLEVNQSYPFEVVIKNLTTRWGGFGIDLSDASCTLVIEAENGEEIYKKIIEGISISKGSWKTITENFTFNPTVQGKYFFKIQYEDETGTKINHMGDYFYTFKNDFDLHTEKASYKFGEIIGLNVAARGNGNFKLKVDCEAEGFSQERMITLSPENNNTVTEYFEIPSTLLSSWGGKSIINIEMENIDPACIGNTGLCKIIRDKPVELEKIKVESSGEFGQINATAGSPIDFNLNIKGISGFIVPLPAELKLSCPDLNFENIGTVSISPTGDNLLTYQVPVPATVAAGTYYIQAMLKVNEHVLFSRGFPIDIPAPRIEHPVLPASINSGDTINLVYKNMGGKDGNFDITAKIYDDKSKCVVTHNQTSQIPAGDESNINIQIPASLKSGKYIFHSKAIETQSAKTWATYSGIQIIGMSVDLNSITLKEKYFDNENVSGKSEITSGSGDIENGLLRAKIIRHKKTSSGIEEQAPGNYVAYNMIQEGFDAGATLYLATDKGLLEHDKVSGNSNVIYEPGYYCYDIFVTGTGEIWLGTYSGAFRRDTSGNWTRYTTSDGLVSSFIRDVIEADFSGGPAIWVATYSGISVFYSGSWTSLTIDQGLPSNRVYGLAKDDTGAVWASTSSGLARFNGTLFESVSAPFGSNPVSNKLTSTTDGSVWMVYSSTLYRYRSGAWDEWNLNDICSPYTLSSTYDMEVAEGKLWIIARCKDENNNYRNILINYDTDFTVFTEEQLEELTRIQSSKIIPGTGNGTYFTLEFGFLEYNENENNWTLKSIDKDADKLPGEVKCLAADRNGNIWAGTDYGISLYNGTRWTNYCASPGGELIYEVHTISVDIANAVYCISKYLDGVIKISEGTMEIIPFSSDLLANSYGHLKMTVGPSGRIWVGSKYLFYYDGDWLYFHGPYGLKAMTGDLNNGVWVGSYDYAEVMYYYLFKFHLWHIKNDLTVDEYSSSNSGISKGVKDRLYMDNNGVLWMKQNWLDYWYDYYKLQSFDGSDWIEYSSYNGFPGSGIADFAVDNNGKLYVMDNLFFTNNLYVLENNTFELVEDNISFRHSLVFSNGKFYCSGGEEINYSVPDNFLTINFGGAGLVEEDIWTQNYNIDIPSGESSNIDLLTGQNFPTGSYVLKTALFSSLDQEMVESNFAFSVRESGISVILSGLNGDKPYIKAGSSLMGNVEILNNTPENYTNIEFILQKQSPSGTVETLKSETLNISSGESFTDTIIFNESETGTWKIYSEIKEGTTVLSESEIIREVTEPSVSLEIMSPQYAGDDPFDFKVKLLNDGKIDAHCQLTVSGGTNNLDETVTLKPLEERIFSLSDTLTSGADTTYTVSLTGDIEATETRTVLYGYVENFNLNVLPSYREGVITIGFEISNTGGLPFQDDVHFELYAVGGTTPLYTVNKSYNLYPIETSITDTIDFFLAPGNYRLTYRTTKSPTDQAVTFAVQPSGIGTIIYNGNITPYPVGINDIKYSISNIDTAAGSIPVTIVITGSQPQPILSETRIYYLEPGETREETIHYDFTQQGIYTLAITGSKLTTPVNTAFQVLNLNEAAASINVGILETDHIPIDVNVTNSGVNTFSGVLVMEIGGVHYEDSINVSTASSFTETFEFKTASLTAGTKELNVGLYDTAGNEISQATANIVISGADVVVSQVPENLEIDAGDYTPVTFKVKNEGHVRGEAILKVTAFDTLDDERDIALEPGEEVEIEGFVIDAAADLPTGNYPFNYTLTGAGVENGLKAGNFNFKVNGISLDVDASFASDYYNVGETAELTITVTTQSPNDASLEAMVNWGEYSEKQTFNLSAGSQQLVFNIPLDEYREDKVFYGIYFEGGKGIHLNDIYLRFGGDTNMVLDKQVYQPGDIVHAVFTGIESGELTATSFDETHTVPVSSSVMVDFAVPGTTLGGTYGVTWEFTPADTSHQPLSGSISFDVSGLVVRVANSGLEKGKYGPGENVKATYTFESNRDDTLTLRCWTTTPTGEWELLGESSVTVSAERHVNAVSSYTFNTTEAGTHNHVYGLYREDQLVVSGSMAFDVGDAVLLGLTTDHFEYKEGNEPVNIKVDYFGEGTAQLELYLDEEIKDQRSLTISGVGSTEISLNSSQVSGGSHSLKVVLTKDGLTSTKSTAFIYGTLLPDLTSTLTEFDKNGLNYTYTVEVINSGKTSSTATSLVFTDNETAVETVSIPALQPGNSHETTFNWSGSGKAGAHEFVFEVDTDNTVKEFSETNNSLTFTEEVPVIFYTLEVDPVIWPANTEITIITRVINNQDSVASLALDLSISSDSTGEDIFQRTQTEELPAFGSKTISDVFNTGVYPAGEYTLSQSLSGDNVDMLEEISIIVEVTKAIDATLDIQPQTITADIDSELELTMTLSNTGNVLLEDEILVIDVFNKDSEEIVKSEELVFSIPVGEQITETKIVALNLVEGNYEIQLKYLDELLTVADLIAVPGIELEKKIDIKPRVLIMNLHLLGSRSSQVEFLTNLLQLQEIEYETGHRILDSYVKLHKGHSNVNIVLGNLMSRNLANEVQERVWKGEGLILVCDKPINSPHLVDFLGVKVRPIKGKDREKHITILPCELSSGGEVELEKKNHLMLSKMKEDVIIVGQTQQKKHPVLAWRKYGNGHVLIMTVPLQFKAGIGEISQLLLNAINHFSKDVYSSSDLTRILPIELSITNKASGEKSLVVKELLPYGVEGYGYDPEPEENEDEELKWNLKVPGAGEIKISYWLKLPDQINIYDIKTEIYEGETLRDELSMSFEVSQTVLSRIDELIVEIESMNATGSDVSFLRKAVNKLQKIRNRTGDSLSQHLVNLLDSVEAAANLGKVKNIDVSSQRLRTQDIMIIMGRKFYEKIKQWGASRLTPFTRMITGE